MSLPTKSPEPEISETPWRSQLRWKTGLAVASAGLLLTYGFNRMGDGATEAMINTFKGIGITLSVMTVWWLTMSGIPLSLRLISWGTVVVVSAIFGFACIRSVWFEGDMRPHIEFRWSPPSASEKAQDWLARNAPVSNRSDSQQNAESTSSPLPLALTPEDWTRYCGPNGGREIHEPLCDLNWNQSPPRELWRHPVGEAWSSWTIAGSRLLTQEQRGPHECVVCYEAETGTELWRHEDPARYESAQGAVGPRATPTITPEAVYAQGATGLLTSLNPVTGELLWQRDICTDAGSTMLEWGMSGSPFVDGDLVIVDAGGFNDRAVLAYRRDTGEPVWAAASHKAGYATPRIEEFGGVRHLLIFHGEGLLALNPETGKRLWEYPWTNQYAINVAQPIRWRDSLFISSGYDSGCVLLDPLRVNSAGVPAEIWPPSKSLKLKFNEAVRSGDFVFGLDDGILCCIELSTGKRRWKNGRYRFGHVLLWQDHLLIQAEEGDVAIVKADPEEYTEVARFRALSERTWNVPVVNRGRLFVRNASEAACFQLDPSQETKAESRP